MTLPPDLLEPFPFRCGLELRFNDIDAFGHVNNATVVTYLENARVKLWSERLGFRGGARDFPFVVARVVVDYRSPIRLADVLEAGVGVDRVGTTSFSLVYRLTASGRLAAEGETVQVCVDPATGRPRDVPQQLRTDLGALMISGERTGAVRRTAPR